MNFKPYSDMNKTEPFEYQPSIRVVFGENTCEQVGDIARELGGRRVLLVTDPGIAAAGHAESVQATLKRSGLDCLVFEEVTENPTTKHVDEGTQYAKKNGPVDLIVGLGGGSAMDCAKGINFLLINGGKMEDYWGSGKATRPMLPAIGIPTTAGTGSEAQSFALIAREDSHEKMACGDIKARFRVVILDPFFAASAPKAVRAIAGMDAISHAVESFVCKKRNAVSQMFAMAAWRLLLENYEASLDDGAPTDVFGKMLIAAHFAGSAIESSMLGAAHACANPLTAHFGLTHGLAVGLMLPHVILFNSEKVNGFYDELSQFIPASADSHLSGSARLANHLTNLCRINDWSSRLRDFDIGKEDLPALAKEAAQQWTGNFNPRPVSADDCLHLYREAY